MVSQGAGTNGSVDSTLASDALGSEPDMVCVLLARRYGGRRQC